MLEINSTYPDSEDLTLEFSRIMSSLRENLTDLEILFKQLIEGRTYISEEETAELLRCKKDQIPAVLRKYRPCAKTGYIYKVSEVLSFIESKAIGKTR